MADQRPALGLFVRWNVVRRAQSLSTAGSEIVTYTLQDTHANRVLLDNIANNLSVGDQLLLVVADAGSIPSPDVVIDIEADLQSGRTPASHGLRYFEQNDSIVAAFWTPSAAALGNAYNELDHASASAWGTQSATQLFSIDVTALLIAQNNAASIFLESAPTQANIDSLAGKSLFVWYENASGDAPTGGVLEIPFDEYQGGSNNILHFDADGDLGAVAEGSVVLAVIADSIEIVPAATLEATLYVAVEVDLAANLEGGAAVVGAGLTVSNPTIHLGSLPSVSSELMRAVLTLTSDGEELFNSADGVGTITGDYDPTEGSDMTRLRWRASDGRVIINAPALDLVFPGGQPSGRSIYFYGEDGFVELSPTEFATAGAGFARWSPGVANDLRTNLAVGDRLLIILANQNSISEPTAPAVNISANLTGAGASLSATLGVTAPAAVAISANLTGAGATLSPTLTVTNPTAAELSANLTGAGASLNASVTVNNPTVNLNALSAGTNELLRVVLTLTNSGTGEEIYNSSNGTGSLAGSDNEIVENFPMFRLRWSPGNRQFLLNAGGLQGTFFTATDGRAVYLLTEDGLIVLGNDRFEAVGNSFVRWRTNEGDAVTIRNALGQGDRLLIVIADNGSIAEGNRAITADLEGAAATLGATLTVEAAVPSVAITANLTGAGATLSPTLTVTQPAAVAITANLLGAAASLSASLTVAAAGVTAITSNLMGAGASLSAGVSVTNFALNRNSLGQGTNELMRAVVTLGGDDDEELFNSTLNFGSVYGDYAPAAGSNMNRLRWRANDRTIIMNAGNLDQVFNSSDNNGVGLFLKSETGQVAINDDLFAQGGGSFARWRHNAGDTVAMRNALGFNDRLLVVLADEGSIPDFNIQPTADLEGGAATLSATLTVAEAGDVVAISANLEGGAATLTPTLMVTEPEAVAIAANLEGVGATLSLNLTVTNLGVVAITSNLTGAGAVLTPTLVVTNPEAVTLQVALQGGAATLTPTLTVTNPAAVAISANLTGAGATSNIRLTVTAPDTIAITSDLSGGAATLQATLSVENPALIEIEADLEGGVGTLSARVRVIQFGEIPIDIEADLEGGEALVFIDLGGLPHAGVYHENMTQRGLYWRPAVADGYGSVLQTGANDIYCRWEDTNELYRDKNGEEAVSKAVVYTNRDVDIGGRLYLGNDADYNAGREIRHVSRTPSFDGTQKLIRAIL